MSGVITPEMEPKVVHESREVYKKWNLKRFGPNLRNLQEALGRDFHRMMNDCLYYGHDVENLFEHQKKYPLDESPWHLSPAKDLLVEDINDGKHNKMIPSQLWCTRDEYLVFSLDIFRRHLYQEVKKREKIASNIRYGKKKHRVNTDESPADEAMPMIERSACEIRPKEEETKEAGYDYRREEVKESRGLRQLTGNRKGWSDKKDFSMTN